jgi:hypothetical protein
LRERESDIAPKPAIVDQQRGVTGSTKCALDASLDAFGAVTTQNEDAQA